MTTTITRWIDYSFARPSLAVAKHDGAAGVIRYICPDVPNSHGKILFPAERDDILHAGLDLMLNFEWYANRALEGHAAGVADGKVALAGAKALGYPRGAGIPFSVDCDTHNYAAIDAYFTGVAEGLGGYYVIGGYGSFDVVSHLLAKGLISFGWQAIAWSGGRRDPQAVIYQDGNSWFHGQADEDLVNGPLPSWLQTVKTPVVKPPVVAKPPVKPTPAPPVKPPAPKPGPPVKPPAPKPAPTGHRVVVVHAGDTLSGIAAKFHTTVTRLQALNHIVNANQIYAGETLHLDDPAPVKKPVAASRRYEVVTGDTLGKIADRFHTTWERLAALNHLSNPDLIRAGQLLTV